MTDIKVDLSLRDRKAERFIDIVRAIDPQVSIHLNRTFGCPVTE